METKLQVKENFNVTFSIIICGFERRGGVRVIMNREKRLVGWLVDNWTKLCNLIV